MSIIRMIIIVGYALAVALAVVFLVRFSRFLVALAQGKDRKALYTAYLSLWTLAETLTLTWCCLAHWQKGSEICFALVGLVKAYTNKFEGRWRKSIPDAEW